jgi:hypothetical protein
MDELRFEVRDKLRQLYEQTEDKYCDGCYFSKVLRPHRG